MLKTDLLEIVSISIIIDCSKNIMKFIAAEI